MMYDPSKAKTICWDCANACGKCSWSKPPEYKPVDGWTAIRNDLRHKDGTMVESYIVLNCPEFVRDAMDNGQRRVKSERSNQRNHKTPAANQTK